MRRAIEYWERRASSWLSGVRVGEPYAPQDAHQRFLIGHSGAVCQFQGQPLSQFSRREPVSRRHRTNIERVGATLSSNVSTCGAAGSQQDTRDRTLGLGVPGGVQGGGTCSFFFDLFM